MSTPDPSAAPPPQSPLSEAVEQATDAASKWCREVADFAQHEAELLSSGDYGLSDFVTAPVRLLRVSVTNAIQTAGVLSDNLALLSLPRPSRRPTPRTFSVQVGVPAGAGVQLRASALEGRLLRYRIPSSRIRLNPRSVQARIRQMEIPVEVEVDCAGAPADVYIGVLSSADGAVEVPIRVAIDELGEPIP
jgi:hypothetical protein